MTNIKKIILICATLLSASAFLGAQEKAASAPAVKFYGFVRNFSAFDTRESSSGTQELFYYMPKDINENSRGEDLNANPSFRFLALTSRFGMNITGFSYKKADFSGKIEADFYNVNGSVAVMRLRQAFININWAKLGASGSRSLLVQAGQMWHPLAADQPYVVALEMGTPFGPFSRTPALMAHYSVAKWLTLDGGFITGMQYLPTGPANKSADYMRYGLIPEMYLGLSFKSANGFLGKVGADVTSLSPRRKADIIDGGDNITVKVKERMTNLSWFAYAQYQKGLFNVNAKTVLAEAGEHFNLISGYGVSAINSDGSWEYTPMRSSVSFISARYGKKWQVYGLAGYMRALGTKKPLVDDGGGLTGKGHYFYNTSGFSNINQMLRLSPGISYNVGKFTVGIEYNMTAVQYGKYQKPDSVSSSNGLVENDLHWVSNNRILTMIRLSF